MTALATSATSATSVESLLAGATARTLMQTADGKSCVRMERVTIDGRPLVVKYLGVDDDWVARATGDLCCRPLLLWRSGLFERLPDCIDHAILGVHEIPPRGALMVMRDVGAWLVPEGASPLPLGQHRSFLDAMAALHAAFWGFDDRIGLMPMGNRLVMLSPYTAEVEAERGSIAAVPRMLPDGWRRLPSAAPRAARIVFDLLRDPGPLLGPLTATPQTLIHGDWKAGNLGTGPDGRTILLDWAFPGRAPVCADLAWYLAVNCDRLPESKEATIDAYRDALRARGVDGGWFPEQLALSLILAFTQLGWSKTFANPAEIGWWEERLTDAARWLV